MFFILNFSVEIERIGIILVEVEQIATIYVDFLSVWTGWKLQTRKIQI